MSNPNIKPRFTKENAKEMGRKGGSATKGKVHFKTALLNTLKTELQKAKKGEKALTAEFITKNWLMTSLKNPAMAKIVLELAGELKQQVELSGPDGESIKVTNENDFSKLSEEQLLKLLDEKKK